MRRGTDLPMLLKVILVLAIVLIARTAKEAGIDANVYDAVMAESAMLVYIALGVVVLLVILDRRGGRIGF